MKKSLGLSLKLGVSRVMGTPFYQFCRQVDTALSAIEPLRMTMAEDAKGAPYAIRVELPNEEKGYSMYSYFVEMKPGMLGKISLRGICHTEHYAGEMEDDEKMFDGDVRAEVPVAELAEALRVAIGSVSPKILTEKAKRLASENDVW